jgi:hypothetical protein
VHGPQQVFNQLKSTKRIKKALPQMRYADIELEDQNIRVKGDVKLHLKDWDPVGHDPM